MKRQRGAAMVEFALIALIFFMLIFGIVEFARAMFVFNTLVEATRRGARVAAVCPVSNTGIAQVKNMTIFDNPNGGGDPLLGLTSANVVVSYIDIDDPNPVAPPEIADVASGDYDRIDFVQVEICTPDTADQNCSPFDHTLLIPLFFNTFQVPAIETRLPRESLGRVTPENPVTTRCCYGQCA